MVNNANKTLNGQQLSFNAGIENFKSDGDIVRITLVADAKQLDLDILNKISLNLLTVDFTNIQTELLPQESEKKIMKINVYTPNFHRITDNYLLDELSKYNSKEKVVFKPNWKSGYKYQIEVEKASELHDFIHNFYAYGKNPKILADDNGEWYIEMKY